MYIFKQPRIGGVVDAHQDSTFLITEPSSVIGLWFAVENATLDNGCLWVVPGSQSLPIRYHFVRDNSGGTTFVPPKETTAPYDLTGSVPVPCEVGTMILLHGNLVHFSHDNKSSMSRHAYTLHFIEALNCSYSKRNWLQRADGGQFWNVPLP